MHGRRILGSISGFFAGLFIGLDLLFFGIVRLDSVVLTVLPLVGLVSGFALATWAPRGRGSDTPTAVE